jgi:aldose 1-epimerase
MQLLTTSAPSVGRGELDGFDSVTLAAGALDAAFAPAAGMAGVSLRHASEELLDLQAGIRTYVERGAVMGIPILHPWANRLAGFEYAVDGLTVRLPDGPPLVRCEEHGLPIHGLIGGTRHWRVQSVRRTRRSPGSSRRPPCRSSSRRPRSAWTLG